MGNESKAIIAGLESVGIIESLRTENAELKEENAALRAELERRRQQRMSSRLVARPSGVRPDIPVQEHLLLDLAAVAGLDCEQEPTQILLSAIQALQDLRDTAELVENVKQALRELLENYDLAGMVYDVRENLELTADFEGSTWDHPKVVRFGDIVTILREALGETT